MGFFWFALGYAAGLLSAAGVIAWFALSRGLRDEQKRNPRK
jgi:hypothetical protein